MNPLFRFPIAARPLRLETPLGPEFFAVTAASNGAKGFRSSMISASKPSPIAGPFPRRLKRPSNLEP